MDITNQFESVFDFIINGLQFCFNTLDSLTFKGISLLDFLIWILILGIMLPILVTLLSSGRGAAESYYHRESRAARSEATYQRHEAERAKKRKGR